MGAVYRARAADGSEVALKLLIVAGGNEQYLARFRREARVAPEIVHPNVTAVREAGELDGIPFIAFELVAGGSLEDVLKREGRLAWPRAAALGAGIARGLAAIHAAGLVHRDLKPANVLLDLAGVPKVGDFGLARRGAAPGASVALTRTGEVLGTFTYMAPEQADDARTVDARADLYSLGCTLYALVAGVPPFEGQGVELIARHIMEPPRPLASSVPEVPPGLDALVGRLLAKKPDDRPASAAEVADELERIGRSGPTARSRAPLVAVAVAAGAVGGAAIAWLARGGEPAPSAPVAPAMPTAPSKPVAPAKPVAPEWWSRLQDDEKPSLPLPAGVSFGRTPREYVNDKDGSILVFVAGGKFTMGSMSPDARDDERPHASRELERFFIGKLEVTIGQFAAFARATGYTTKAEVEGGVWRIFDDGTAMPDHDATTNWRQPRSPGEPSPDHPVEAVTYADATAYCAWAGLRLPDEQEWEKAAVWNPRTGRSTRFSWGDTLPDKMPRPPANLADLDLAWKWGEKLPRTEKNAPPMAGLATSLEPALQPGRPVFEDYHDGFAGPAPVGSFPAGASPCGALDMIGNVFEWTSTAEPFGDKPGRIVRGGSWGTPSFNVRGSFRGHVLDDARSGGLGFRVARDAR
jgi:serine/threonine-protein kinase